ncbi:MCE family protein [Nocardioides sp. TRM66260-LWL]|uniref:MCE family protein n=1 Tax=Nocardioides sp. TRM66260-LWL TaxID=2874478 RepID=UPI001CC34485|nr:MlaD family protein [Nocardioides sp. TRM66260-LWL]MBZ5732991.1 MCE family protein [Nocardioides sp. TRM66260-LWL]
MSSPVLRRRRADLIRLTVFLVLAGLVTAYLVVVLGDVRPGERREYRAVFRDVSGLEVGDQVRVASVAVGTVRSVRVRPDATVEVAFDLDADVTLNDSTTAAVRYRNLIGDRYVELKRPRADAPVLAAGATIPASRTRAAVDLDTLLNGFKPLFAGLNPTQINDLSGQLVEVLQGQRSAVTRLVSTIASLTPALADREQLIGSVVGNLDRVVGTLDGRRDALGELIDQLDELSTGLARDDDRLLDAAARIDTLARRGTGLVDGVRPDLTPVLESLATGSRRLNGQADELDRVLKELPRHFLRVSQTASYGNFFNFFLCGVRLRLADLGGQPLLTPWIYSDLERCRR